MRPLIVTKMVAKSYEAGLGRVIDLLKPHASDRFPAARLESEVASALEKGIALDGADYPSSLQLIGSHYAGIALQGYRVVSIDERARNCHLINQHQLRIVERIFKSKDYLSTIGDQKFSPIVDRRRIREKLSRPARDIVLYGRFMNAMDPMEFAIAWVAANEYVRNDYSLIFTDVKFAGRTLDDGENPSYKVPDIGIETKRLRGEGKEFLMDTAIGANIVHFTHGSPEQAYYGSVPILGIAVLRDDNKMAGPFGFKEGNYVPLQLDYSRMEVWKEGAHAKGNLVDHAHSFAGITGEIIRSLRAAEEMMLRHADKRVRKGDIRVPR